MTYLPHLAARIFNAPLLIHRPKLEAILAVLGPRIGWAETPETALRPMAVSPSRAIPPVSVPGIALIPIHGTLVRRTLGLEAESGLTSYEGIASALDAALASSEVEGILLDIDSPGGEAAGVLDLADRIAAGRTRKPVWAVANEMAFSAAYALASGASRLWVTRMGGVGSIGVLAMHVDRSVRDAREGFRYTTVFAGKRKDDLNPHQPITSEGLAFLRSEVDRIYGQFVETVAKHRGLDPDAVRDTEAALYFGRDAVNVGLADAVGTFDETLSALAGCTHRIAEFLAKGVSPDAVRRELLAAKAAAPEVQSRILPEAGTGRPTSLDDNPVVRAAKARVAGAPGTVGKRGKRKLRSFAIPHIPHDDVVLPEEVQGIRAFGSESETLALANVLTDHLQSMRNKHSITLEHLRMGALKGVILDADGSTLYDLYTEFEITPKTVNFALNVATTDVKAKCLEVLRYVEDNLKGERMTMVHVLVSQEFFDSLTSHAKVEKAYERWQDGQALRTDMRADFAFAGITFEEYRGVATDPDGVNRRFIAAGEAHGFPLGTMDTFATYFAPADFNETANTLGQPLYAKQEPRKFERGTDLHTQSNPLPMCHRPAVLVKLLSQ